MPSNEGFTNECRRACSLKQAANAKIDSPQNPPQNWSDSFLLGASAAAAAATGAGCLEASTFKGIGQAAEEGHSLGFGTARGHPRRKARRLSTTEPPWLRAKAARAPAKAWGSPSTPITTKLKETKQTPKRACARSSPARSASSAAARASSRGASPCGPRSRCASRSPRTIEANWRGASAARWAAGAKRPESTSPSRRWTAASTRSSGRRTRSATSARATSEPFDVARPRVVLIVRGSSDDLPNLDGELDAVRACARKAAARVVECVSLETLGEALKRATSWRRDDFPCGARPRVWLHVAGHATELHLEDPQKRWCRRKKWCRWSRRTAATSRPSSATGAGARGWRPRSRKPASRPWAGARTARTPGPRSSRRPSTSAPSTRRTRSRTRTSRPRPRPSSARRRTSSRRARGVRRAGAPVAGVPHARRRRVRGH